jgi:hypothetical protein
MSKADFHKWAPEAKAVTDGSNPLRIPYDVYLRESAGSAAFIYKYWDPGPSRPGLVSVQVRLPRETAADIQSQIRAVQYAQTELLLVVDPAVASRGERARAIIDELESVISFTLDDEVEETADEQLAQIQAFHSQDGERSSALAQGLRNYAALGRQLGARLTEADGDFDPRLLDEAEELADDLIDAGANAAAAGSARGKEATAMRNRLLSVLHKRVTLVRRVAAHVFRRHPEIVREVTSAYERRRRSSARREAEKGTVEPGGPAPSPVTD